MLVKQMIDPSVKMDYIVISLVRALLLSLILVRGDLL